MTAGKEKSYAKRRFTLLSELSRHIVDRCNVISIDRVPKTKSISQKSGPEEKRFIIEREEPPDPSGCVEATQETIETNRPIAKAVGNKHPKRFHWSCPISLARPFLLVCAFAGQRSSHQLRAKALRPLRVAQALLVRQQLSVVRHSGAAISKAGINRTSAEAMTQ